MSWDTWEKSPLQSDSLASLQEPWMGLNPGCQPLAAKTSPASALKKVMSSVLKHVTPGGNGGAESLSDSSEVTVLESGKAR